MCKEILYSYSMIESFMHKGLEELFEKGKSAKVQASSVDRIRDGWTPQYRKDTCGIRLPRLRFSSPAWKTKAL
jgi:hypothetical protein